MISINLKSGILFQDLLNIFDLETELNFNLPPLGVSFVFFHLFQDRLIDWITLFWLEFDILDAL